MKMSIIICLAFLSLTTISFTQTGNWETINISNWGQIKLPPSMEVQSGTYKKLVDELKKEFSISGDRIVFQQKGLNSFGNFETYARVIIKTEHANPGDFPKLKEFTITQNDLSDINSNYKQSVISVCNSMNANLIKWTDAKVGELNGTKCIYFNYTRQVVGKPSTFSEFYVFFNYDKQHSLNVEYRLSDSSIWQNELESCKKTFRFK